MDSIKDILEKIRAEPDTDKEFLLKDVSNAVLVDMLIEALQLIQLYQMRNDE